MMMTSGQQRALRELKRLCESGHNTFELVDDPYLKDDFLVAKISLRLGLMETREGGLDLREREEFTLFIPPDFPFDIPLLYVAHARFAGFPHVIWSRRICLYQSNIEWNPSDGLYGFFERLYLWLERAALNDMDPIEGPLEPPHHVTDFSQKPFVIRADAPCNPGDSWMGLALLEDYENRIELVGWDDLSGGWPTHERPALALMLPDALPMEFPAKGAELLQEIERAGISRESLLNKLAIAALLTPGGEPVHLVVGLPMRRAVDGAKRLHIAVWTTEADKADALRKVLPENSDDQVIRDLRKDLADTLLSIFELSKIAWCRVLDDRPEIVVRRDHETPIAWFEGKKVLVLGCGALGSWVAEIIVRANANLIHLVDDNIVKPGILVRQNFQLKDIGANKARALGGRIMELATGCTVEAFASEAHFFLFENLERFHDYDVILDCTASNIFQQKLERDWAKFTGQNPRFVSMIIDAHAKHCLCVAVPENSNAGVWDAYQWLKWRLATEGSRNALISAFYSDQAGQNLFQPEPGCSDPTFRASAADIMSLASTTLNNACEVLQSEKSGAGIAISAPEVNGQTSGFSLFSPPEFYETVAGEYRVRMSASIFAKAKAWIQQNNRLRSLSHETGGLLWGVWDDAVQAIWIYDLSGPPPDSQHDPGHFICGIEGTAVEHEQRMRRTFGTCGFIGYWHTHPNLPSHQSSIDITNMTALVSSMGQNQKRALMLIFGRTYSEPTLGIYVYETQGPIRKMEIISMGASQMTLSDKVI